ncbi:MAG: hypothetical protein E7369_04630 [Clostridiales bacterium]|nr:hypothetical protein [Clostridiales bacterium]
MKKTGGILFFIGFLAICGLLNVVIFLTMNKACLDTVAFWLTWSFAFPLCILSQLIMLFLGGKYKSLGSFPFVQFAVTCGFGAYLIFAFICAYIVIPGVTLILILELVITVAIVILVLYFIFAMKTTSVAEKKVQFIRTLQSNVESCAAFLTDGEAVKAVKSLSEKVRFSDPMSHPSLATIEGDILGVVNEMYILAKNGEADKVVELVKRAEALLELRNRNCLILK